jgi:hypothetical protein
MLLFTGLDHGFDEFSDDVDSCPVSTVHDYVPFPFVLGEFLCIIVLDVTLADGGYF